MSCTCAASLLPINGRDGGFSPDEGKTLLQHQGPQSMSGKDELRSVETHFKFGENWRSFVDTLSERSIEEAERGLTRLFPMGELQGRRLLDIGCGSGLHMLAAQRLGAAEIVGIDLDSVSVSTAQTLLSTHVSGRTWSVNVRSVFDPIKTKMASMTSSIAGAPFTIPGTCGLQSARPEQWLLLVDTLRLRFIATHHCADFGE